VGPGDPPLRLTALCLAAHTDFSTGRGYADVDRIARECGLVPEGLFPALDQLVTFLASWTMTLTSGDLRWELLPTGNQNQRATDRFDAGVNPESWRESRELRRPAWASTRSLPADRSPNVSWR
jgi:hypothetical protein